MVWSLTVLGLGIVFAVLGILYLFFVLIGVFFSRKRVAAPTPEPVMENAASSISPPVVAPPEDTETVAVIGAVIAAITQGRGRIARVRNLGRREVDRGSKWKHHEPAVEWRLKRKR